MNRFSVIGAGNLGCAFIRSLTIRGWELQYVLKKAKDPQFSSYVTENLEELIKNSDLILLSVQESKIATLAKEIASHSAVKGKVILHTSNSLPSRELEPIRKSGGYAASFSPLQTFPAGKSGTDIFKGAPFLLEGDDVALRAAAAIALALEAEVIEIAEKNKKSIHIASIAVSNFLVALFMFAERRMTDAGMARNISILYPLFHQTWKNIFESGAKAALSGPLARGEEALIESHLHSLKGVERDFYRFMTDYLRTAGIKQNQIHEK